MRSDDRNSDGPEAGRESASSARWSELDAESGIDADQTAADNDQTAADNDQTAADNDQTAADDDQASADRDQLASDHDQATADRDHAARLEPTTVEDSFYDVSREARTRGSLERFVTRLRRANVAREREIAGIHRDRVADERDVTGLIRDEHDRSLAASETEALLMEQLEALRAEAAADRSRAAADRQRAAEDRANASRERARLEAELRSAHLDELTGAYRREMGRLALSHEIDRARRSDGRFVLAFVDVDGLKDINDRDGHAAGDRVLQSVVRVIRTRLRSFDPILRYGGDEFVCGLGGTDLGEAERRFDLIGVAIEADARVAISVGLAELAPDETIDGLTERADAAMLEVKARHHASR